MAKKKHHSPKAAAYARSILDLAISRGEAAGLEKELSALAAALSQIPSAHEFLSAPAVSSARRLEILQEAMPSSSVLFQSVLGLLADRGSLKALPEIAAAYHDQLESHLGHVDVDLTVAEALPPGDLAGVAETIGKALGKQATLEQVVDPSIIGGLMLHVDGKLIDASVKNQLKALRRQLLDVGLKRARSEAAAQAQAAHEN